MKPKNLSINHVCFFFGLVLLLASVGISTVILLITGNMIAILCVVGFGLFVFGFGVFFVIIVRKKLVLFSEQLCELLDGMISGKEKLPEGRQSEEGLFYKIHYRLSRLYEVLQKREKICRS